MNRFKISAILALAILFMVASNITSGTRGKAGRVLAASPAQTAGCTEVVTHLSGALGNFTVSGSGSTTLTVQDCAACSGLQSIDITNVANSNVVVGSFTPGTHDAVPITATAVDPTQPSSFTVTATEVITSHFITFSVTLQCPTQPVVHGCTFTQGYWKNHPNNWPVSGLTLGNVFYTEAQLISILKTPVKGNGLISLSYQLIAAKLNAANGTTVPSNVQTAISNSDALIGNLVVPPVGSGYLAPSSTAALNTTLDTYNNGGGAGAPPHCGGDDGHSNCP